MSGLYTYRKVAEKAKVTGIKTVYIAGDQPLYLACSPRTGNEVLKRMQAAYQSMRDDGAWARIVTEGEKRYGR